MVDSFGKVLNGTYINFGSKRNNPRINRLVKQISPDKPVISNTSSVLGIAKLGRMILNKR